MAKPNFEKFLTKLRTNYPNLSKEQIAEKIIGWVDQNSVDAASEKKLLNRVYLIIFVDKLNKDVSENATYLKNQANDNDIAYYFKTVKSEFEHMDVTDPDLKTIFDVVRDSRMERENAAQMHKRFINVLKTNDAWSLDKKKQIARKFSRHFRGTKEEISARNAPPTVGLVDEYYGIPSYFTRTVSNNVYKVYFENIKKEIEPPPEGFFAQLRFNYSNDMAFLFKVLKNSFSDLLFYGLLCTAFMVITIAACVFISLMADFGMPFMLALSAITEIGIEFAYVVPIIFAAIVPLIAGDIYGEIPLDGYLFTIKIAVLTAVVGIPCLMYDVVSYPFKAVAFWLKKPALQEEPEPQAEPEPNVIPDPLAPIAKENQNKQQQQNVEPVSESYSFRKPGLKSSVDADALD